MARYCHPPCQKDEFFCRRCLNSLHCHLVRNLLTALSIHGDIGLVKGVFDEVLIEPFMSEGLLSAQVAVDPVKGESSVR